jgi:hypothetical protein
MQGQKTELSVREKKLLLLVAVVALLYVALQFGFVPMSRQYRENREVYDELVLQKRIADSDIADENEVMDRYDEAREKYQEIKALYYQSNTDTELIRMMREICVNSGLIPADHRVEKPVVFSLEQEDGDPVEYGAFSTVRVTMTVTGNYYTFMNLLDNVEADHRIRIPDMRFDIDPYYLERPITMPVTFIITVFNEPERDPGPANAEIEEEL